MKWNPSKTEKPRTIVVIGVIAVAMVFTAVGFVANSWMHERVSEPYAGGALIDATGPIICEEDDDVEDLGVRLVALAAGETFTQEQIEQLKDLVAGLFWAVSFNSWLCEELSFKVEKLESGGERGR